MSDHEFSKSRRSRKATNHTTDARAAAQRAKLDAHTEGATQETARPAPGGKAKGKKELQHLLSHRRANMSIERAIANYLLDHEGEIEVKKLSNGIAQLSAFCGSFWHSNARLRLLGTLMLLI
jgi:hypothetical protein